MLFDLSWERRNYLGLIGEDGDAWDRAGDHYVIYGGIASESEKQDLGGKGVCVMRAKGRVGVHIGALSVGYELYGNGILQSIVQKRQDAGFFGYSIRRCDDGDVDLPFGTQLLSFSFLFTFAVRMN